VTAVSTKVAATESTSVIKTSPNAKTTASSPQQAQTPQSNYCVQTVQRVKSATMTLAPVSTAQGTKNAIVVTNTGQTAQVITLSINLNRIMK